MDTKNTSFKIHGFMTQSLGLSGNELLAFALVYSFTKDGESVFHASVGSLSEVIGCTRVTAGKAIATLIDKNYIKCIGMSSHGVRYYRVNLSVIPEEYRHNEKKAHVYAEEKMSDREAPKRQTEGNSCRTESDRDANGMIRKNGSDKRQGLAGEEKNAKESYDNLDDYFIAYGPNRKVMLTFRQHDKLVEVADGWAVDHYINRLNDHILKNPDFRCFNHYKLIRKWMREDGEV